MPFSDTDVDLLDRARSGDAGAYQAVVTLWADLAGSVAYLLTADRIRAAAAVRDAFVEAWRELPSMHSERPFRPWLIGKTVSAALAGDAAYADVASSSETQAPTVRALLGSMEPRLRSAAVLAGLGSLPPSEVGLAIGENLGRATRLVRQGTKALRAAIGSRESVRAALAAEARGAELPTSFFHQVIAPSLERAPTVEVRRLVSVQQPSAWAVLVDSTALEAWVAVSDLRARSGTLRPGARLSGRGSIANGRASSDETLITRVEPERLLGWRTRSSPARTLGAIEFAWSIELVRAPEGTELVHRLDGVAFPAGFKGRSLRAAYDKVSAGMQASMHHGMERLAALMDARARSTT